MGCSSHAGRGISRRRALGQIAAGIGIALGARAVLGRARAETPTAAPPPRYWILVVPAGGIDAVWTTDPRTRKTVAAGVDVPYPAGSIVSGGRLRFGPHFAALAPKHDRLAILNGVLTKAANHYTGIEQVVRLRTSTTMRTPAVFDIIGAHRDSQALAHVVLNPTLREGRTPSYLGTADADQFGGGGDVLAMIDDMPPEQLHDLAKVVGAQIDSLKRRGNLGDRDRRILDSLGQARALFDAVTGAPRFASSPWLTGDHAGGDAAAGLDRIQRALWLIENDLAATVTVCTENLLWDTHAGNTPLQSWLNPLLAASLAALLDELSQRSNRHGRLVDQTAVIVSSEIGRFPYLNRANGKDHFPQTPVMFSGRAFRGGQQFGATGTKLEALPVSPATGRRDPTADRLILDDVGYTALRIAGLSPESFGLAGRELRFLRAT